MILIFTPTTITGSTTKTTTRWPKQCPTGFAQHLVVIDNNCEINYCVKKNSLSRHVAIKPARRPPFRHQPKISHNITVPLAIINDDTGQVWIKEPNGIFKWVKATER